jgi:hypothetical protein
MESMLLLKSQENWKKKLQFQNIFFLLQGYTPLVFQYSSAFADWKMDGTPVQSALANQFEFFTSNMEAVG